MTGGRMSAVGWAALGLCWSAVWAEVRYYDAFSGAELTAEQKAAKEAVGADSAFWCMNAIESCSVSARRRHDGSCNNLAAPTAGAAHQPFERLLPARFDEDGRSAARLADGGALPAARGVRRALLASGVALGEHFSQLSMLFNTFVSTDFTPVTVLDIVNYVALHPTCCGENAAADAMCSALAVPAADVLTRLRGIACLNHTRPIDFQSKQCIAADVTPPHRINYGSAHLDLKPVYGVSANTSERQRLFAGGRLNHSAAAAADGLQWPAYSVDTVNTRDGLAGVGGTNFFMALMFWREHNRIASELEALNPLWSDEELFETARDINIAQYSQIFFYENLPDLFGSENLVRDGVISAAPGFREVYSAAVRPGWWHESLFVHRWFHTIQNGNIELMSADGVKQGDFAASLTVPTSIFNSGNNLSYFAQGCYRTNSAKADNMIDPFLGETALWPAATQAAADVASIDLAKGRLLGLAPYVDYLQLCDGVSVTDYDQLEPYLDEESRTTLRAVYGPSVRDVELLAALWREGAAPGAQVPKTLYCLAVKQLVRNIQSDRHWYERESRPHAFTAGQLAEIRKANIARVLCDNTRDVATSGITLRALRPLSAENPIVSCSSVPRIDLSLWTATADIVAATTVPSTPVTSATVTSTPVTSATVTSTPVTSSTATSTPVTSATVTSTPVTSSTATSTPVTSATVTSTPVTSTPVTSTPVTSSTATSTTASSTPVTSTAPTTATTAAAQTTTSATAAAAVTVPTKAASSKKSNKRLRRV